MRRINIRQLQRKMYTEIKHVPFIVTRLGKNSLIVSDVKDPPVTVILNITVKDTPPVVEERKKFFKLF